MEHLCEYAVEGNVDEIEYRLVSSDYLKFNLLKNFLIKNIFYLTIY